MKIMFFGLGSIGMRHLSLLQKHFDFDIYAFRTGYETVLPGKEVRSWGGVDWIEPNVAFICNPSHLHIETAMKCAQRGMDLFIEKPVDVSCDGLDELLGIVEEEGLKSYVAYPFRFHPAIESMKDDSLSQSFVALSDGSKWPSKRPLDHVMLELSHEIDVAEHLYGEIEIITGSANKQSAFLDIKHVDNRWTRIMLSLSWGSEQRYVLRQNEKTEYQATDQMYLDQLRYFFETDNPMNSLSEAAPLFRKIIEFRG